MAKELNKKDLGFENYTIQEMVETYHSFYAKEKEEKNKVVIFKIQIIE